MRALFFCLQVVCTLSAMPKTFAQKRKEREGIKFDLIQLWRQSFGTLKNRGRAIVKLSVQLLRFLYC